MHCWVGLLLCCCMLQVPVSSAEVNAKHCHHGRTNSTVQHAANNTNLVITACSVAKWCCHRLGHRLLEQEPCIDYHVILHYVQVNHPNISADLCVHLGTRKVRHAAGSWHHATWRAQTAVSNSA